MRPLASPVTEYRVFGLGQIAGGLLMGVVAVAAEGLVAAVVEVLLVGLWVVAWMYLLGYRRLMRRAAQDPPPPPTSEREPPATTRRRMLLITGELLVFLAAVALVTRTPGLVAGIAIGNGAGLVLASRWLARWEVEAGRRLLREPRWRFSRPGRRGWGRGRGLMDPSDFYAEA